MTERPRVRIPLIGDLAAGEQLAVLAERYGVSRRAVTDFRRRHAEEIEQARAGLADELSGLWIANKAARLESYQGEVERIDDTLELMEAPDAALIRCKAGLLRNGAGAVRADRCGSGGTQVRMRAWLIRALGVRECGAFGGMTDPTTGQGCQRWCRKPFGHSDSCAFDVLADAPVSQPGHTLRLRAKGW